MSRGIKSSQVLIFLFRPISFNDCSDLMKRQLPFSQSVSEFCAKKTRQKIEIKNGKLIIIHSDLLDEKARNNHQSEHWKWLSFPNSHFESAKTRSLWKEFLSRWTLTNGIVNVPLCGSGKKHFSISPLAHKNGSTWASQ